LSMGETSGLVAIEVDGKIRGRIAHPFALALQSSSRPVLL